ncbi:hypothetical protein B0G80_0249 [Paraburkholderia sp. BL6669N2]|uniref:hypothetical protein n=1 Tax=Paraburkholderia sp. BL6669N2 TaxID=1938807 RepID=UPI000E246E1B|nr:hypothetical protein [Paraburkholderia sp. BL6669N2]REG57625.1 hypothetical protein B0G80_0249 [Paraburkholderia sp. BL6669N2]
MTIIAKDKAAKLLFAQLCIALEIEFRIRGFRPDFEGTEFISSIIRDKYGRLQTFSGAFVTPTGLAILPFSLSFGGRGDTDTGLGSCAIIDTTGKRKQIFSYLSILEYLINAGLVKPQLDRYMSMLTKGGKIETRVAIVDKWPVFRSSAIKTLPYDLALEFEYADMVAA